MKEVLPNSWEEIAVSTIGDIITGNTPSTKDKSNYGTHLPYVKPPLLNNQLIDTSEEFLSERGVGSARVLPINSILVSCIGNLGRTALNSVPVAFNQQINAIVPYDNIFPKFIFYQTQSHMFRTQLEAKATATTIAIVNKGNFEKIVLNIAPLNEQHRIVEKIEELFSELDKGIENLKTAREQLKVYRQVLLKHAFEGKLTEQWRAAQGSASVARGQESGATKDNADKLETADQLLVRIKQERETHYQQQLEKWEKAVKKWEADGKEGKKPIKPKETRCPYITEDDVSKMVGLPELWKWGKAETIASPEPYSIGIGPFGSNLKVVDYRTKGIPLIFVKNITRSNFSLDNKYIDESKFNELMAHSVKPLDILITKMGDPPGDCEIYPQDAPMAVLTADCLKFRVWNEYACRGFYLYCIRSGLIKKQLGLITKGVAQKKISVARFKGIFFPIPPLEEQKEIFKKLEQIFSVIQKMEDEIEDNLQHSEALRQSILKKAFSGQLISQDPTDEPASELLKRIAAEKAKITEQAKSARVTAKETTGKAKSKLK